MIRLKVRPSYDSQTRESTLSWKHYTNPAYDMWDFKLDAFYIKHEKIFRDCL